MITAKEQQMVLDKAIAAMREEFQEVFQQLEKRIEALESGASAPKVSRAKAA